MPELFDVVELLVTLPESNLHMGVRGAIVDCYDDQKYEVEFSDRSGETIRRSFCGQKCDQLFQ